MLLSSSSPIAIGQEAETEWLSDKHGLEMANAVQRIIFCRVRSKSKHTYMAILLCLAGAMRAALVVVLRTTSWSCPGSIDDGGDDEDASHQRHKRRVLFQVHTAIGAGHLTASMHPVASQQPWWRGATRRLQPCPHRDDVFKGRG
jgi:hypothetical protein